MNINDLTLGQIKEIKSLLIDGPNTNAACGSNFIGSVVLVRTYSAGVHFGVLVKKDGTSVLLENARRLWKWSGAFTLNEVATKGVSDGSRVSCPVDKIELTEAIEIIPMNQLAIDSVINYEE